MVFPIIGAVLLILFGLFLIIGLPFLILFGVGLILAKFWWVILLIFVLIWITIMMETFVKSKIKRRK